MNEYLLAIAVAPDSTPLFVSLLPEALSQLAPGEVKRLDLEAGRMADIQTGYKPPAERESVSATASPRSVPSAARLFRACFAAVSPSFEIKVPSWHLFSVNR